MINVKDFFDCLKNNKVNCFCGVPDSLLKDFCAYITDNTTNIEHTITANEGNAIGLASGHYLATGNIGVVYMQNSGIGNCVNPLLSLTDEEVYNIPLLMLIGWRGEPDKKDEPQHIKQGKVTDKLLDCMGIKYSVLSDNFQDAENQINVAFKYMRNTNRPYAFIIRKGTFEKYSLKNKKVSSYTLIREEAIEAVIKKLNISDIVVSTTGHISREVYETRERLGQSHKQDFLTVGSMGHSSSIALGIALQKPTRKVFCFDGDGAFLMHMGAIAVNSSKKLSNFKHIIFNNEAHDSVGSQPTVANCANLSKIAKSSGYKKVYSVFDLKSLNRVLEKFINDDCTALLEIKVKCGAREDLGRPKEKPIENKKIFMENLNQIDFIGENSIKNLNQILKIEKVKSALVFTGKKSFENIKPFVEKEFKGIKVKYYNDFSSNPKEEEVKSAIRNIKNNFDIIIAIGGGSVLDFAKSYRYYSKIKSKLVAIPTTFGTGAEATQFVVIYVKGVKTSLDNPDILPEYAIIDSQFAKFNSKYLKTTTAMDTYSQAIESFWAVRGNDLSRNYAKSAIELCKKYIVDYVNSNNSDVAQKMALASHLAGMAINISRTTASHALSYKITSDYNIPHGHAVSLTIAKLFEINLKNGKFDVLKELICENPREYFKELFKAIDLEVDFKKLGINDITGIAENVNIERLSNNPVKLSKDDILNLLDGD